MAMVLHDSINRELFSFLHMVRTRNAVSASRSASSCALRSASALRWLSAPTYALKMVRRRPFAGHAMTQFQPCSTVTLVPAVVVQVATTLCCNVCQAQAEGEHKRKGK